MKKGALLVNLGSPDSTSVKDVKRYLGEFLMDERVIDISLWKRTLLVKGIILNTRPRRSAAAYQKIWWVEGSPLIVYTQRLAKKVKAQADIPVEIGMRYGNPSIKNGLQKLKEQGVDEVLLIPLYPHYAMSSYETVVVKAQQDADELSLNLRVLPAFFNEEKYINVLSQSIQDGLPEQYDHILFSYHGIPERHIYKSDTTQSHCKINGECCKIESPAHQTCYRHQCYKTTDLMINKLQLPKEKVSTSFQSRLGRDPWLTPYTDKRLEELAHNGVKNLVVITPAFVSDCLETIEEIGMEGKKEFIDAGGEKYTLIPCLNDRDDWSMVLAEWINEWNKTSKILSLVEE